MKAIGYNIEEIVDEFVRCEGDNGIDYNTVKNYMTTLFGLICLEVVPNVTSCDVTKFNRLMKQESR